MVVRTLNETGGGFNLLPMNLQQGFVLNIENEIIASYSKNHNRLVFLKGHESSNAIVEFLDELELIYCMGKNYTEVVTESFGISYFCDLTTENLQV